MTMGLAVYTQKCACVVDHPILYYTQVYYNRKTDLFVIGGIWSKSEPPQGMIYFDFISILGHEFRLIKQTSVLFG